MEISVTGNSAVGQIRTANTKDGPHSAATLAELYLPLLIEDTKATKVLQAKFLDVMTRAHANVQSAIRIWLDTTGQSGMPNLDLFIASTVQQLLRAAYGTPVEAQITGNMDAIRTLIARQFATSFDIERQWHDKRK